MRYLSAPTFRKTLFFLLLLGLASANPARAFESTQLAAVAGKRPDVYFLRGFGDVFSRGLDQIASTLKRKRVKATVLSYGQWPNVVSRIVANRKKYGRRPVILVGHSLGANAALRVAKALKKKRISVSYMATLAATAPPPASSNIRKLTNYYFKKDGWGKPVRGGPGFRGVLKNIDFSKNKKVGHFNIDSQPRLQREVVRNVLRHIRRSKSAANSAASQSETAG